MPEGNKERVVLNIDEGITRRHVAHTMYTTFCLVGNIRSGASGTEPTLDNTAKHLVYYCSIGKGRLIGIYFV